jgi:hypothetical protein
VDDSRPISPLTHGELPCPNCGYQRRGLPLERDCPECGARGFDGSLVVSGLPGVSPETRTSERIYKIGHLLLMIGLFVPAAFRGAVDNAWRGGLTTVAFCFIGAAAAFYIRGFLRRRQDRASNVSLERVTLEFRSTAVIVRIRAAEHIVPLDAVRELRADIDRPGQRTRVWLVTRGINLPSHGFSPLLIMTGDLANQRVAKAQMEQRVRNHASSSKQS